MADTITNMPFYPDVKPHISPSAFAQWHRQRSAFIRSYFKGEKTVETQAMKAGTKIHGLIEAGFLDAVHNYMYKEKTISTSFHEFKVLGIPDSFEVDHMKSVAVFVDYKTGKENHWTKEELATDLKMLCTAWLVWIETGKPKLVRGFIEWIGTTWNGSELVPTGEDHVCVDYLYTAEVLEAFENTLLNTLREINEEWPKFLESTGDFVSAEDCALYADLEQSKKKIEDQQKEIKERIQEQMQFGGVNTYSSEFGTFYITEKKTYEYPPTLIIEYGDAGLTLVQAEEIAAITSATKKQFELDALPISVSKSVGFRTKKATK